MDRAVNEKKRKLRKRFIELRKKMSAIEVYSKSCFIFSKLINTEEYQNAEIIHCYVSISIQNEVETRNMIQHMLDHGKIVALPKIEKNGRLSHFIIQDLEELQENKWGVAEPVANNKNRLDTNVLDLVIVPMVAGDEQKNRLGYGKGYYDRFLSGLRATKTGVLFDAQLFKNTLPRDKFDVQLDMLITESTLVL